MGSNQVVVAASSSPASSHDLSFTLSIHLTHPQHTHLNTIAMAPAAKKESGAAKPKTSSHASYQDMIIDGIMNLKDRNGSSRQALKKYVRANNNITVSDNMFDALFNKSLKSGVEKGVFEQPKGPSGGTKLAKKKPAAATEKKPAAEKKAAPKKATAAKKETTAKKPAAKKAAPKKAAPKKAAPKKAAAAPAKAEKPETVLTKTKSGRVAKAQKPAAAKKAAPKKAAPKKAATKA